MNAEQLHSVCKEIMEEIDSTEMINELEDLESLLGRASSEPQEDQHQQDVANGRSSLDKKLSKIESSKRTASKIQIIEEIGWNKFVRR